MHTSCSHLWRWRGSGAWQGLLDDRVLSSIPGNSPSSAASSHGISASSWSPLPLLSFFFFLVPESNERRGGGRNPNKHVPTNLSYLFEVEMGRALIHGIYIKTLYGGKTIHMCIIIFHMQLSLNTFYCLLFSFTLLQNHMQYISKSIFLIIYISKFK